MALIILITWPRLLLYWTILLRISGDVWQMFYVHVDVSAPGPLTPCHANKTFIKLTERTEYHLFAKKLWAYWIFAWCALCILQDRIIFLDLQASCNCKYFAFFMPIAFQGSDSFPLRLFYNIQVKCWNNLMAGGGNTAPFITVTVMTALYKWEKLTNTINDISEWTENSPFLLKTHTLKCLGILQFGNPMLF